MSYWRVELKSVLIKAKKKTTIENGREWRHLRSTDTQKKTFVGWKIELISYVVLIEWVSIMLHFPANNYRLAQANAYASVQISFLFFSLSLFLLNFW